MSEKPMKNPFSKPPSTPPLRFHILCVPHTVTRKDYSACAFTQKALKFCKMMHRRGHIIYHYGHKDSEVECTEHIAITDDDLFQKAYGVYDWKKEIPKHNTSDLCNTTYNQRAIVEVGKRKKPMAQAIRQRLKTAVLRIKCYLLTSKDLAIRGRRSGRL